MSVKRWIIVLLLVSLALGGLLSAGDNSDDEALLLEDSLVALFDGLPWLRDLVSVSLDDDALTVIYLTNETGLTAYRAEILEMYRMIGERLAEYDGDETLPTRIILEPSVTPSSGIETITIDLITVLGLADGTLTRTAFLNDLEIEPGPHQIPDEDTGLDV